MKSELYYLRDDTEMMQPYKISSIGTHFETGKEYVCFYSIRTDDPQNFVIEKDEFIKQFKQVVEVY